MNNQTQSRVVEAVQAAAGNAWVVSWCNDGIRISGNRASKFHRGKIARIEFDDPQTCDGCLFTGSPGGLSGSACTLAAISVTDPQEARRLIRQFEDSAERAELLYQVFGEE